MYVHICNRKFYNEYVLSYCINKRKVTCQITSHKKDVRYALPQRFPTFLTRGALFRINFYAGAP